MDQKLQIDKNIQYIIDKYDDFIFDIWGVLHSGDFKFFTGILELFKEIKLKGKKSHILSNAPHIATVLISKFNSFGFSQELYSSFTTSGQFFFESISSSEKNKNYFIISTDRDILSVSKIKNIANYTDKIEDATDIIITNLNDQNQDQQRDFIKKEILPIAKKNNCILHCLNPDRFVIYFDGSKSICPGIIASDYQEIGGIVKHYGKPKSEIYEFIFNKYNINRKKSIMIGDTVETDIVGASNVLISSILVLTGNYAYSNLYQFNKDIWLEKSKQLLSKEDQNSQPEFILDNLQLSS
jgi:HAD superfamily hydrolase (TIGR01459 family)